MTANDIAKLHEKTQQFSFEPLSLLISDVDRLYKLSIPEQKQLKLCLIKKAVTHYSKNNPYFKKRCDKYNHKHIPPYRHFSVREPNDLPKEVTNEEIGQLAIFDLLSLSVSLMIQTENLIFVSKNKTQSWHNSQRINYVNRPATAKEFSCCAINHEKNMHFNEVCFSKLESCNLN